MRRLALLGILIGAVCPLDAAEVIASDSPVPAPARTKALSPTLSAALTAKLPAFNPPGNADKSDEDADDFDLPVPRNGIIRLPRVVVEGNRPPVFTEREIYTDKGLADLAVKRYFTDTGLALNRYRLPLVGMTKETYALMLWQQDRRLGQIREFSEQATLDEALGEEDRAAELRDLVNDALGQPPLFHGVHRAVYRDARGQ